MTQTQGICIVAEINDSKNPTSLTFELLGLGRKLAAETGTPLNAIVMGSDISAAAQEVARYGTEEVFALDHPGLAQYDPEKYMEVLSSFLKDRLPHVILAGHTAMGQDLLPRLACSLGAALVTDCVGVKVGGGEILFTRPIYGGNALATQKANTDTVMATVRARVGDAPAPADAAGAVTAVADIPGVSSRLEFKGREVVSAKECPLEEAPVVVSGGRGMGGEEAFEQLRELAGLLRGAVGASRPPVDSGWAPTTCQVGITGKVVAPDIYVAVAISGSTQHLSGMGESGKIVAINKDPEAYIFKVSDYGVVGDWKQVLPSFTATLRELLQE
ncbi:MAG: electron transfer flavoprotein subunit alpha/FixB family protein [Actinobacteria bacterium]|nr:electron transfer flavoprotein subunit alpha/FixB family protein [Actinomycetota bacterium]